MKLLLGSLVAFAILVPSFTQAKSCSDALKSCLKMYDVPHGSQGAYDPVAACRNDYNGCMSTGTWAGQTVTVKGLEKK
jgi:hypothetical protein